ncbi:MAG: trypsin-like peptidase domain-containing protein [Candidatus Paceibacteria bacterium]
MDIERLTKMQIVLLTLLVSFVTSIATGIVTVTLMDQAPPAITQTINRVVERTVEKVVPDKSQGASVITKEVTVVVKEDDLITDSIDKNSKSVVRIKKINADGEAGKLVGLGVIVSRDGMVATDPSVIEDEDAYIVETADAGIFNANVVDMGEKDSVFLAIEILEEEEEIVFSPVAFSNEGTFKLGQTVISLTGEERTDVAIGIISGLIEDEAEVNTPPEEETAGEEAGQTELPAEPLMVLSLIKTSIDEDDVLVGSPLIDMFGEVVGISTTDSFIGKTALFEPVLDIKSALSEIQASEEASDEVSAQ